MEIELYSYQLDAVNKLRNGSILQGSVGSGKSRTSLAYYYTKILGGNLKNNLSPLKRNVDLYIITTARKRNSLEWEDELSIFDLPKDINVTIDSWNNIKKYVEVKNSFFIFDEQRVVGAGAWVKAFLKIVKSNYWILVSATPGDSWSDYIPIFIANGFYKNRTDFIRQHAVFSRYAKYPKIERYIGVRKLINLRDEVLVKMDYIHKIEIHKEYIFSDYDLALYRTVWKDRWDVFDNEPIENPSKLCYLIRKIVNSDTSRSKIVKDISTKNPKLIIFYNFDYELEILRNIDYVDGTIISEYNGKKHEEIPDSERWVYLVQYTAGCEAWNCIKTNVILFYSLNYSYKVMKQAAGRIDRLNTPYSDLYYIYIKSKSPIDMAIFSCLKKKKDFNERKFIN